MARVYSKTRSTQERRAIVLNFQPNYTDKAIEHHAIQTLKQYKDGKLLTGSPSAIPIEDIVEFCYGLSVEYLSLRNDGRVLGQTVFEDSLVPIYTKEVGYTVLPMKGKTIILDTSLLQPQMCNRARFTLAHELAHWILHKEYFIRVRENAANIKSQNHSDKIERQADKLAGAILMPMVLLKRAAYGLGKTNNPIKELAKLFQVSEQAMTIRMQGHSFLL